MESINAFVPLKFYSQLLPFNAELLKGNAMLVRACGAQGRDGSILRSKSYLLFGNGVETLMPQVESLIEGGTKGYVMRFVSKKDNRQVEYWEVQSTGDQTNPRGWTLGVSSEAPDNDDGMHVKLLVSQHGGPGQYIFLSCVA